MFAIAAAQAQPRPYIGFTYPAGGQQGTTFQVRIGGQGLDDIQDILVNGPGVSARLVEYHKVIGPQEVTLLNEQLRELRRAGTSVTGKNAPPDDSMMAAMMAENPMMAPPVPAKSSSAAPGNIPTARLISRIERRIANYVNRPACSSLASIAYAEVTIAADAPPGERELRVATWRGVSNPMVFHVGQLPEVTRKPMITAAFQVLGKEELALRKRPANEVEARISLPCTVNGQIASAEVNRYRFAARKSQRLVITTQARQLIPYIADAVPGWFQPVLTLYSAAGREVAYCDDYRFNPDPTLVYEVPHDGEYVLAIQDSLFRGREDFVYRVTIGELPFVTSIFPLGGRLGEAAAIRANGWNLAAPEIELSSEAAGPGVYSVSTSKDGFVSNRLPFAWDTLPEITEKEQNSPQSSAQKIELPLIVNGRIGWADDRDVFQFNGRGGSTIVAEVYARRLDSPLDSVLKVTDAAGQVLASNDDFEDLAGGVNTHHADSYLMATLPTNGTYFVHVGDTARSGGDEYGYRLRVSAPRPDFALRVVPSSISIRSSNNASVTIYAMRRDGFTNTIRLGLKDPPPGFSAAAASLSGTQTMTRLNIRAHMVATKEPVTLHVAGTARVLDRTLTNVAVPAEDRMQAFLWRHLVPASELKVLVYDPSFTPPPKRVAPPRPAEVEAQAATKPAASSKPRFTKQQVAGRLRQLKLLFEEGLLTDEFYHEKVAECESAQ